MQDSVLQRERVYLVLVAAVSALAYYLLTVTIIGLVVALILYLVFVTFRAIAIGFLRGNGVLATSEQLPELHVLASEVAASMGMERAPDVWVFQAGRFIEALTRRFVRGHHVVLANELAELAWEGDEQRRALRFLLAQEFASVTRQLPIWWVMLTPGRYFPLLGKAWSRATALTFDRMAACVAPEGVAPALAVYGAGPEMFAHVHADSFAGQAHKRGFWAWGFELLSRQRPLARRAEHLAAFTQGGGSITGIQHDARGPSGWSIDRVLAGTMLLAAPLLAAATLVTIGPDIFDEVRDRGTKAVDEFKANVERATEPQ